MKQTIYFHDFVAAFKRLDHGEQFSCGGLKALFEYLEDVHYGNYDLDVVALCCEWSEYCDVVDINMDYGQDFEDIAEAKEWLEDYTVVLEAGSDTLVILAF